jgi:hypothetical protein
VLPEHHALHKTIEIFVPVIILSKEMDMFLVLNLSRLKILSAELMQIVQVN